MRGVFRQKSGIVNVYSYDDVMKLKEPKPIKFLKNLTTPIQNVKINSSSELLAMNSYHLPRAVRLVRREKIQKKIFVVFLQIGSYANINSLRKFPGISR